MDITLNALPRRLSGLHWGVLLPFVLLVCTVYWGFAHGLSWWSQSRRPSRCSRPKSRPA